MDENFGNCIDCGKCTGSCAFLSKYGINLKEYAHMPELAYGCFLCGECRRACTVNIDGRQISLELRKGRVSNGYQPGKDGYGMLLFEKKNYIFKNYRRGNRKTVFFPGCNFTAYFPKTTQLLSSALWDKGIGTVYDCCGKPVDELGIPNPEYNPIQNLNKRFEYFGIEEIIVLCPNCYHYLKGKINIKLSSVYDQLFQLNITRKIDISDGLLYLPCPDRDTKELYRSIEGMLKSPANIVEGIQCCGAGGCAAVKESKLADGFKSGFSNLKSPKIYTYCATCSSLISKSGTDTEHILCRLFNPGEKCARGLHSLKNRALSKFKHS